MPETKSEKPKSPPAPSSGGPPSPASPVSQDRSPSRRAINPSTLMPRKTDPVREASMALTVAEEADGATPSGADPGSFARSMRGAPGRASGMDVRRLVLGDWTPVVRDGIDVLRLVLLGGRSEEH